MLLRKRHQEILRLLENRKSVTLQELMEEFSASESTIRRDLTALHKEGKLVKVFGVPYWLGIRSIQRTRRFPTEKRLTGLRKSRLPGMPPL